ncbi:hypothetical protein AZE42_13520 [Rhizopogon vesiculosus]|uniref:Aminotransferase class I/classII large domain-containing protein n=1 Tax=Rhizopogon vesiculosus TaxID=180088 RepID=A0A1J8Q3Q4_9AGAM|nr:hypothetical protein AZE42_13520 [Rhizopogon vesiculosus]
MGFASGPKPIIDAIDLHFAQTATANLQASSLTQAITLSLVEEWGYNNFFAHTEAVANFYRKKRDVFDSALNAHLGGLAEWYTPEAGMFFWFKLLLSQNQTSDLDEGDSEDLIRTKAYEGGVLALPGTVFLPNGRKTAFVRASFSLSTEEQVNEALKRLRTVLLKERGQV